MIELMTSGLFIERDKVTFKQYLLEEYGTC